MHPAAAEAGRLAGGVQAVEHRAVGFEHPAIEVGFQAAQRLSGQDVQLDRDQRTRLRVGEPVRGDDAADPVGQVVCARRGSR